MVEVPVAFVVAKEGQPIGIEERILDACRQQLSEFKVPRGVRIVRELPRAGLGKVAKHDTARGASGGGRSPAPSPGQYDLGSPSTRSAM